MADQRADSNGRDQQKNDWSAWSHELKDQLRKTKRTQRDMARDLGLHPTTLNRIVSGTKKPLNVRLARQIANWIGDDPEALVKIYKDITGEEEAQDSDQPTMADESVQQVLRPFLLQAEVRLSSLHRTAACLLGASSLMLAMPLFFPAAPAQIITELFTSWSVSPAATILLAAAMGIVFVVPMWGFILVIGDLLSFFFTGNRFGAGDRSLRASPGSPSPAEAAVDNEVANADSALEERFNPRLTLHGLQVPDDVLPPHLYAEIEASYEAHQRILIPDDAVWQKNFRLRIASIFGIPVERALALKPEQLTYYALRLAVSRSWPIASEAAKMEILVAKHILAVRIALLRFIKALLLIPVTAISVLIATSLIAASHAHAYSDQIVLAQLIGVFMFWGPIAVTGVGAPVRWIFRQSPGGGEVRNVYDDPRMVRFEAGVVFLAAVSAILILSAAIGLQIQAPRLDQLYGLATAATGATIAWIFALTFGWKGKIKDTPKAAIRMLSVGRGN